MADSPFDGPHPYRDSLAAGVGAGLAAGAIIATVDIALSGGSMGFAAAVLGLYALPALLLGLLVGVINGAIRATWGEGAIGGLLRALRQDRARDAAVTGALIAGVVVAPLFAVFVARGAMGLVAEVINKPTGALLLGLLAAGALPLFALLALPIFRVTRRVASTLPPIGQAPSALVVVIFVVLGVIGAGLAVVFQKLEWRALDLPAYALLGGIPVVMLLWGWLWYGRLDAVRRRVPGRGAILGGALAIAVALPVLTLWRTPSAATVTAVTQHSTGAHQLVAMLRGLIDRDGDGFSAFFGGPDCDDHRKAVHPGALEEPGNGIDDNCLDGDRPLPAEPVGSDGGDAGPDAGAGSGAGSSVAGSGSGAGTGTGSSAGSGAGSSVAPGARRIAFDGNFLFVMVDTVRADRLGIAGYQRDGKSLTPRLDAFAAEAAYFTRTYAQAPNTPRSLPSFFSSRYPSLVKVDKLHKNYPIVADENELLFETLQAHGLHTTSITSHFFFQPERTNFMQGFDEVDNEGALDIAGSNHDIAAPRLVPKVESQLGALAASKQRFAMFVHLFEPHSTYMEHPENPAWAITESGTDALAQKYDFEIAYVDGWIGKILDALAANGLDKNTMVVILADHGEGFGAHRFAGKKMFFHGQTLYDELLRVPMLMRIPGVAPRTIDAVTELIDMAPTVLDVLGIPAPKSYLGRSLVPGLLGEGLAERPAHAELLSAPSWDHNAKAMVSGDGTRKVIYVSSESRFEAYDLKTDPGETKNLLDADAGAAAAVKQQLTDWIEVELPAQARAGAE